MKNNQKFSRVYSNLLVLSCLYFVDSHFPLVNQQEMAFSIILAVVSSVLVAVNGQAPMPHRGNHTMHGNGTHHMMHNGTHHMPNGTHHMPNGTHHMPNGTHHAMPPHEGFFFSYDPTTHMMSILVNSGHTCICYIDHLTQTEQMAVHTSTGLRHLELKMLSMISTVHKKTEIAKDRLNSMSHFLFNKCGGNHMTHAYLINI